MDASTFDRLARAVTATPTRRTMSRLLGGALLAGACRGVDVLGVDPKRRKRRRKKKKKRCNGGEITCGGACCDPERCINGSCCREPRTCGAICCAADEVCADPATELCVVGQGTCASGADTCAGNLVTCNGACGCFQSTSGATRCGGASVDSDCGQCTTDADCEVVLGAPGAFCVKFFGGPPLPV